MRRSNNGATLIEVLVATVVTVLLTTGVLGFAVSGLRLWHLGADKVDVNESALVTIKALNDYLRTSDINSVYINPSGVASGVSFLCGIHNGQLDYVASSPAGPNPAAPPCSSTGHGCPCSECGSAGPPAPSATAPAYADDGRVVWHEFLVIYLDPSTHTVRLGTVPLSEPSVSPSPYRLDHYTPTAKDAMVAGNIDQLELNEVPFGLSGQVPVSTPTANPLYAQVTASKTTVAQPATMQSAVYLDNGLEQGGNTGETACCP